MILDADAIKGLAKIYGSTDQILWVYRDDDSLDVQLLARRPNERPFRSHPRHPYHGLVGWLDLTTGRVRGEATEKEDNDEEPQERDLIYYLVLMFKAIIGVCVVTGLFVLTLIAALSGGGGSMKGRR
jgi:hypothetical protein